MVNTRGANGARASDVQPGKSRLQFNEKLVGKGHSTEVMLARLKKLHEELAKLDQDNVELTTLGTIRKELISPSITLHKDKGVKAFAACCLADVLKLYAPDAPYTQNELRDIFGFFFDQLKVGLKGSSVPYYEQYFYLLDSLAKCKSVVLICDLPNAEELMHKAFTVFFSLVRNDLVKNIEMAMSDILCALIDECTTLPQEVLDLLMAQFSGEKKDAGFRLGVEVCNSRADRLQRHVCAYFTDAIVTASQEEDTDDLQKTHDLVRRLNAAAPSLLHSVVPQLEEQLRVDNAALRAMATQTLGGMFADKNGAELSRLHPHTWAFWTSRKMDKAAAVRVDLVGAAVPVLVAHPELRKEAAEILELKLEDPDERVRIAVCRAYASLGFENALHHIDVSHLRKLAERGRDKKAAVRTEAFAALGKLYQLALPEIENNNVAAINHFSWIPEVILHLLVGHSDMRPSAEHALAEYIIPLPPKGEDETAWTERLLLVMRFMDDEAVNTLISISNLKLIRPSIYDRFIESCEEYNGGTMDANEQLIKKRLAFFIQRISLSLSLDRQKTVEDLQAFANANEQRLYALFRRCADATTDLKTLAKSVAEFSRRLDQLLPTAKETLLRLVRVSSHWIVNSSSVSTLLSKIETTPSPSKNGRLSIADSAVQDAQVNAKKLWCAMSKWCPATLKGYLAEFAKVLSSDKNSLQTEMALQALSGLIVMDVNLAPTERRIIDRLVKLSLSNNARHAKFASRILATMGDKTDKCDHVVKSVTNGLIKAAPPLVVAHIAALAQFAKFAPDAFEAHSEKILEFVVQDVLMKPCPKADDEMDVDDDWAEDKDLPDLAHAKLLAIKMCRNRSLARASADDVTVPVLRMLFAILEHNGSIREDANDSGKLKTRMRFRAAVCLLQLATVPAYAAEIVKQFPLLALTVQDACYTVRMNFLTRYTHLAPKLESRFNMIPFLTAQDPEHDIREKARQYASLTADRLPPDRRLSTFELTFIRFLHLLAHHPDFTSHSLEALQDMHKYIAFYVDTICNEENVALMYHLASRAKTIRDAESHAGSENLYILSEMAQEVIKGRAGFYGWSINNYPGKVKLPTDIFKHLPTVEAANIILKTVYLPEEMQTWLEEHNKPMKSPVAKARVQRIPRKRKAASKASPAKRARTANGARKKQDKWSGTDNGEDSDSPIEEETDEEDDGTRSTPTPAPRRTSTRTRGKPQEEKPVEDADKTISDNEAENLKNEAENLKVKEEDAQEDESPKAGRGARTRARVQKKPPATSPKKGKK